MTRAVLTIVSAILFTSASAETCHFKWDESLSPVGDIRYNLYKATGDAREIVGDRIDGTTTELECSDGEFFQLTAVLVTDSQVLESKPTSWIGYPDIPKSISLQRIPAD